MSIQMISKDKNFFFVFLNQNLLFHMNLGLCSYVTDSWDVFADLTFEYGSLTVIAVNSSSSIFFSFQSVSLDS